MAITGRFGIEIELNSLDRRDFAKNPLSGGEKPAGIVDLAEAISRCGLPCEVQDWGYNHNLTSWICKPDGSCGIEICSPVMAENELYILDSVMGSVSSAGEFCVDDRCSFHVHLELDRIGCDGDLGAILAWWLKCEHVFLDMAPPARKNNGYCKPVGLTDVVDSGDLVCPEFLFKKLSSKHFSINTFHLFNRRRASVEFRIAEGTKDPRFAAMWVRTLLGFARSATAAGLPADYLWMRPGEVLDFLDLGGELEGWFLRRLLENSSSDCSEFFSSPRRAHAMDAYRRRSCEFDKKTWSTRFSGWVIDI